jgi:hypothetical protein
MHLPHQLNLRELGARGTRILEAFEILQLMSDEAGQVDDSLEFWLMGSFAVVVAAHAARESLTSLSRHALVAIYALFCLTTLIKFWADVDSLLYYAQMLEGSDYTMNRISNAFAGVSRLALYLFGSAGSITYIYLSRRIA